MKKTFEPDGGLILSGANMELEKNPDQTYQAMLHVMFLKNLSDFSLIGYDRENSTVRYLLTISATALAK